MSGFDKGGGGEGSAGGEQKRKRGVLGVQETVGGWKQRRKMGETGWEGSDLGGTSKITTPSTLGSTATPTSTSSTGMIPSILMDHVKLNFLQLRHYL